MLFISLDGVELSSCLVLEKNISVEEWMSFAFLLCWSDCECRIWLVEQRTSVETMMSAVVYSMQQDT